VTVRSSRIIPAVLVAFLSCAVAVVAEEARAGQLPPPHLDNSKSLAQALKDRKSTRAFSAEKLPAQILSNLLWAAFGINRPESEGRTAPSAMNCQEIDVYAVMADGAYLYDAKWQTLKPILTEDIRAATGGQPFVKDAPLNLIFVADSARIAKMDANDKDFYSATDVGYISQNVYLYCASEGLATVVRGSVNRTALAKTMKLRPGQKIILAQTVGYPKK
jgi:SagB-type dehydrogenase family enzyme